MNNNIIKTVSNFKSLLEENQAIAPIFTRFRTSNNFQILPVNRIRMDAKQCIVQVEGSNEISFSLDELIEVTAFRDANNSPVFISPNDDNCQDITETDITEQVNEWQEMLRAA